MSENGRRNGDLTRRQRRFVAALLTTPTVRAAAKAASIGEATGYRWVRVPAVRAALAEAQAAAMAAATQCAVGYLSEALDVLHEISASGSTPSAVRVSACRALADAALTLYQAQTIEERLSRLEEADSERAVAGWSS